MEAVGQHGWALKFACEDLRRDKEVVMEMKIQQHAPTVFFNLSIFYPRERLGDWLF